MPTGNRSSADGIEVLFYINNYYNALFLCLYFFYGEPISLTYLEPLCMS